MTHNKEISLFPLDTVSILRNFKTLTQKYSKKKHKKKIKLAFLSISSTQHLKRFIELFLNYFDIDVTVYESQFGQYYEESVFPNKKLKNFNPDFIWVNISNKIINEEYEFNSSKINVKLINKKISEITTSLLNNYNSEIIINNLDYLPQKNSFKLYRSKKGLITKVDKINNYIHSLVIKQNITLLDLNLISSNLGLAKWNSISDWTQYKYHPSLHSSVYLCFELSSLIKSFLGNDKKCIVLDLDNTLWDGVIGDIGHKFINMDKNDPIGASYFRFNHFLKNLKKQGIILTIVSKNSEDIAMTAFKQKSFIFKKEDFAMIQCNWKNKDENIKHISQSLNILTKSMVFIDDNPFERNLVKNNIPDISVPDMPEDHSEWINFIQNYNYFYNLKTSIEDKNRTKSLKITNKINKLFNNEENNKYMDYLKSLNMKIKFSEPASANVDRTIQLINKTNQFNATNLSLNSSDINILKTTKNKFIYLMTLTDNVTDYGIISIIWGNLFRDYVEISNWVMSCRVFNRHLEDVIIYKLFNDFTFNKSEIRFKFNKTVKNKILLEIFTKLGCQLSDKEFIIQKSKFKSKNHKLFKNSNE